jgi:hypothetical protein
MGAAEARVLGHLAPKAKVRGRICFPNGLPSRAHPVARRIPRRHAPYPVPGYRLTPRTSQSGGSAQPWATTAWLISSARGTAAAVLVLGIVGGCDMTAAGRTRARGPGPIRASPGCWASPRSSRVLALITASTIALAILFVAVRADSAATPARASTLAARDSAPRTAWSRSSRAAATCSCAVTASCSAAAFAASASPSRALASPAAARASRPSASARRRRRQNANPRRPGSPGPAAPPPCRAST